MAKISLLQSKSTALDSRIQSANVQASEKWLGFFAAPALMVMGYYCVGTTYLNVFYTDVLKLGNIWGGFFMMLLPIVSKIVDAITNIIMGRIIDSTHSRQGKARPWILVSGPLVMLSGILLYAVPKASQTVQVIWVMISYNLYFAFAYTIWNMSNILTLPLSTRNIKQRDSLAVMSSVGMNMIPGAVITMLFPAVILPLIGVDQGKWITVMGIASAVAVPATLIQYYFVRERVTEENESSGEAAAQIPFGQQIKACFHNTYWLILMAVILLYQLCGNFNITSMAYYCNWVLGSYNDGITMTITNAIGQAPLGIGVFLMLPLTKKFGKKNCMMIGFWISALGCLLGWLIPNAMGPVLAALAIKSMGLLPGMYILSAVMADVLDYVEYKEGFRCDGFSASVYTIISTASSGIAIGLFNIGLSATGYVPPAADGSWVAQSAATQGFISFAYFGAPAILYLLAGILFIFYRIEKQRKEIQDTIVARHRAEAEANGREYISPEEAERREQEKLDREAEEKRLEELKAKCAQKGLNFEEEERKYQEKLAARQAKKNKKK